MAAEAPSSVTDGIRQQLDSAHAQAAAAKPIGARLDSAQAKVTRATKAVEAAQEALRMAEASLIASRQAKDAADKELSELQAVARAAPLETPMPGPHPELAQGVRRLLDVLEQSRLIDMTTNAVPEKMLAEMQSLHSLLALHTACPDRGALPGRHCSARALSEHGMREGVALGINAPPLPQRHAAAPAAVT